ncbi:MAG: hypothetical protein IPO62_17185 [Saprospiraceae bacterium]|nr:hypothetical protein [Saprospiraceae bacterium]
MKNLMFLAFSILTICTLTAQHNISIGLEGGPSLDRYEMHDEGGRLVAKPLYNGSVGINVGFHFMNYFSLETALIFKDYTKGYGFAIENREVGFSGFAYSTFQIPLRVRGSIPLYKDKIFLSTVVGYHHSFIRSSPGGRFSIVSLSSEYAFESNEIYSETVVDQFSLLETGLGLEFRLINGMILRASAIYFTGFADVTRNDLQYSYNGSLFKNASVRSKGEYASLNLGLNYTLQCCKKKMEEEEN